MLNHINYMLLDAARMGEIIEKAKEINPDFDSLYRGRSEEALAVVAPYLFLFKQNTDFGKWYIENGWGNAWGILIRSHLPMPELHKHFRKFLIVGTEDNQELYFRFYDPRVLRIFLPTCSQEQLKDFFGPIEYFVMEDEDKDSAIRCWLENGLLRSVKMPLNDLINNTFELNTPKLKKSVKEIPVSEEQNNWQAPPGKRPQESQKEENKKGPEITKEPVKREAPETKPETKKGDSKWKNFYFD